VRLERIVLCAAVVATLAGCSGSTSPMTAPAQTGATSQAAARSTPSVAAYDANKACALLSPADIKTAIGTDVKPGAIGDRQAGLWVECRYYRDTDLIVRVQVATASYAASAFEGDCQATVSVTIAGADRACWDSGLDVINVLRGGVEFGVIYSDPPAVTSDEAKTTALVTAALANLGKLS
jgi:hypothetical protein